MFYKISNQTEIFLSNMIKITCSSSVLTLVIERDKRVNTFFARFLSIQVGRIDMKIVESAGIEESGRSLDHAPGPSSFLLATPLSYLIKVNVKRIYTFF